MKTESPTGNCSTQKVYICIFACHSSRAVHLELLQDTTTESFLLVIKRMANRRSTPRIMHSDNASEIIQGKNHIQELYQKLNTSKTHEALSNTYNIYWYHSTERSPSHNGLIERRVQIIKKPLYKTLNGKILTKTEMNTILTDYEATANMRPLSATTENAEDNTLWPITPSHLILGKAVNPLPTDTDSYEEKISPLNAKERWNKRKQLSYYYWQKWKGEYPLQLRSLTKNYVQTKDLNEEDVALLPIERISKLHWALPVVQGALKARDGKVRSEYLRLPIKADRIDNKGIPKTEHKYIKSGIEQVSLLEEALDQHYHKTTHQNEDS